MYNLCRKSLSVMRRRVVNIRAKRNDAKWINRRMASIVMPLDVFHFDCTTDARHLKNVFGVIEEIRVLP
jgi:hypothetical protein